MQFTGFFSSYKKVLKSFMYREKYIAWKKQKHMKFIAIVVVLKVTIKEESETIINEDIQNFCNYV